MLKNDFAYEVNGFCTRFANYFFAISLQDRQIVISSQFKKLERLVSHTNIFKTCSIGDGENVLKIHSKEKKVHHKKKLCWFFSSFWKKAHDLNDDIPLYCESLVFATTPKSRKVVCKKSINHGNTMDKCFKKVKTWARGYFVSFSLKQKLHTDSLLNFKNKKNRRNKKWKKNPHLISKLYHFTALCKFTLKNSDGRMLRSLFLQLVRKQKYRHSAPKVVAVAVFMKKKNTRHTFFRFQNFYVKTYNNPPFSFKGSPLTEIVLVAQDYCGGSLALVPPRAVIRSSAGKSASDDHITKTKSIAWTYYMMYIEGAPLMLVILLMQYILLHGRHFDPRVSVPYFSDASSDFDEFTNHKNRLMSHFICGFVC